MHFATEKNRLPETAKVDTVDVYFGTQVPTSVPLSKTTSRYATAEWVKAQNEITAEYLSRIPFRDKLLKRMTELADYER